MFLFVFIKRLAQLFARMDELRNAGSVALSAIGKHFLFFCFFVFIKSASIFTVILAIHFASCDKRLERITSVFNSDNFCFVCSEV